MQQCACSFAASTSGSSYESLEHNGQTPGKLRHVHIATRALKRGFRRYRTQFADIETAMFDQSHGGGNERYIANRLTLSATYVCTFSISIAKRAESQLQP